MKVVLYMRYSSDRQTEASIEGQERVCRDFCRREGYEVVDTYIDRALSARSTDKRVAFLQMINDSAKGNFQAVIVYKLDRFSRNRYDSATFKYKLRKNGVKVISATENISNNPEGVLLESVLEGMAEFYSLELSQKITRGMYDMALKGNCVGGHVCLGYDLVDKKLVINEKEAKIVREAFERFAKGEMVVTLCNDFNARGYRTKKGALFNKNSFRTMFHNEKYIGIYRYMDIEIKDGVPAIISKDLYDEVAVRLAERKQLKKSPLAKVDFYLTGKLFCGECGTKMTGTSSTGDGGIYHYYHCKEEYKYKRCSTTPIKKEFLEDFVVKEAQKLLTPDTIERLATMCYEEVLKENNNNTKIKEYKQEMAKYNKKINNLLEMVADVGYVFDTKERINKLQIEKKKVELLLRDAEVDIIKLSKEMVIFFLEEFTKDDLDKNDHKSKLFEVFVNKVLVTVSKAGKNKVYNISITWNLELPKTTTTLCYTKVDQPTKED